MHKHLTMSPCRAHRLRSAAHAKASANAMSDQVPTEAGNAYAMMMAKLSVDERALRGIQSIQQRIELKARLLPDYAPWIDGILAAGVEAPDRIIVTIMIWRIDVGDIAGALDIAEYALQHGIPMPDRFRRDLPTTVAEEIADNALRALRAGTEVDLEQLTRTATLMHGRDMPDQVRAKLLKAIGLGLRDTQPAEALAALQQALLLHDGVGVKKEIEQLERLLKNQA